MGPGPGTADGADGVHSADLCGRSAPRNSSEPCAGIGLSWQLLPFSATELPYKSSEKVATKKRVTVDTLRPSQGGFLGNASFSFFGFMRGPKHTYFSESLKANPV